MKRLPYFLIGIVLCFSLGIILYFNSCNCGKSYNLEAHTETGQALGHDRFYIVEGDYNSQAIFIDSETGVEYLWICGGLTILVDHNGKPLIAEGYRDY